MWRRDKDERIPCAVRQSFFKSITPKSITPKSIISLFFLLKPFFIEKQP